MNKKTKMTYTDDQSNNLTIEFTDKSKKVNVNYLHNKYTFDFDFNRQYKLEHVARFVMKKLDIDYLILVGIESR